MLLAGLAALLAGCSDSGPDPTAAPSVRQAYGQGVAAARLTPAIDAWIAGDAALVLSTIRAIKTDSIAARSTPEWETACTPEASAARTANFTAILAQGLDEPTVMAMSDMARMDYLDALGQGKGWARHEIQMPIEPDCTAVDRLLQQNTAAEWRLLLAEMPRRRAIWYTELKAKYGTQYGARHLQAADLLRANGIPSTVYGDD
ncbi:MAG: hypothetical protein DCF28_00880 [Alphaproteobacteria bacterium]|nr:MAG: hypothetical protein DCF28_00880 [Alphaproteobacteria bacterium]